MIPYLPGFLIVSVAAFIAFVAIWRVRLPDAESGANHAGFDLGVGLPHRVRMRGKRGGLRRYLRVTLTERKAVS